jgi:hypothetical protein
MSADEWSADGLHPVAVMRSKDKHKPCERKDKNVEVEDHGNGFMFVGCSDIDQAKRILKDYVPKKKERKGYVFAARTVYQMPYGWVCCVWLTPEPMGVWDGAEWMPGYPVER